MSGPSIQIALNNLPESYSGATIEDVIATTPNAFAGTIIEEPLSILTALPNDSSSTLQFTVTATAIVNKFKSALTTIEFDAQAQENRAFIKLALTTVEFDTQPQAVKNITKAASTTIEFDTNATESTIAPTGILVSASTTIQFINNPYHVLVKPQITKKVKLIRIKNISKMIIRIGRISGDTISIGPNSFILIEENTINKSQLSNLVAKNLLEVIGTKIRSL